jgi:hypothetical protein
MKTLVVAAIGLAVVALANPAAAYVIEATASIPLATVQDHSEFKAALESAIDDVVTHAIAFAPSVVTVQDARVAGNRLYILLLIADEEGEETMKTLSAGTGGLTESPGVEAP